MTPEENDLLCRVEGDAPMGAIMRRHWIAACLSEEVAAPDGTPIRVKLLGEDLVVFRDSKGRLGVLDEFCAHRRASLVYARNEECGLRCLYHGWKFDVDGNVVEMASEPAESNIPQRVKHKAYPAREAGRVRRYGMPYAAHRRQIMNEYTPDYSSPTFYITVFTALIPLNNVDNVATLLNFVADNTTIFYVIVGNGAVKLGIDPPLQDVDANFD